jgi:hypothetical protein
MEVVGMMGLILTAIPCTIPAIFGHIFVEKKKIFQRNIFTRKTRRTKTP